MATPLKKAAPKASTKKGTTKSAPKTVSRSSAPKGVTVIPEGSTVIPDHKYDDVIGYLEGSFPEIGKHDETLYLLLAIVDSAMPGPNLRFSYSKVRETFKDTLKSRLTHWDLSKMGSDGDVDGYNEFLVSGLKGLLDNICGYNTSPAVVNNTVIVQPVIPIPQRSDGDLIKLFVEEPRDEEVIAELEKRSKGSYFLAYKGFDWSPAGCDSTLSEELLKRVRKGDRVPRRIGACSILRISEIDIKNRIRHECPLCPGTTLVHETCPVCGHDFKKVHRQFRQRLRIAAKLMGYDQMRLLIQGSLASLGTYLTEQEGLDAVSRIIDRTPAGTEFCVLRDTDRLPSLMIVDSPAVFDDPQELRRFDAFHRNLGGK